MPIDELVQDMRSKINKSSDIAFEQIPYDQFYKEIGKEGSNAIYIAIWKYGPLYHRVHKMKWAREQNTKVVLKLLYDFIMRYDQTKRGT